MAFMAEDYLAFFGFPKPVKRGTNWSSSCPDFEGLHSHGDKRYSWALHEDKLVANCFVCGGMSLELLTAKLLSRMNGTHVSLLQAVDWLEERYGIKNPTPSELAKIGMSLKEFDQLRHEQKTAKVFPESIIYPYIGKVHGSLLYHPTRQLSINSCKEWDLGYDKLSKRSIIPLRKQNGRLIGVISRAAAKDDPRRYMVGVTNIDVSTGMISTKEPVIYIPDIKGHGFLYGEHRFTFKKTLLVVESALDVVWLTQLGYSEQYDICATVGAGVNDSQILSMMGWEKIILGLDADPPGQKAMNRIEKLLQGQHITQVDWAKQGAKDPGALKAEDIEKVLTEQKSIFTFPALV